MVSPTKPPTKYWVTYIKGRIKRNKNFLGFISGQTGCLDGNTEVKVLQDNKIVYKKIKDMNKDVVVSYNFTNRKFEYNPSQIIKKGIQEVYKITFSDGDYVLATKDHRFFRPNGEEISVDKLMDKKERYRIACRNYPLKNENKFYGKTHTSEFLKYKSKLHFKTGIKTYRKLAKNHLIKECKWCGHTEKKLVVHHIDGDRHHNDLTNLIYLCVSCHTKYHKRKCQVKE